MSETQKSKQTPLCHVQCYSPDVPHELLVREYTVKEEGYVFMYVSNTSPVRVYFDDVKFTYTPTNVIQYNEYYPFGLQTSNSWTRVGAKDNDYLYNAGSELNNTTGWYEMFFRGYDPTIGRMLQVDPLAAYYHEYSPYNFAGNNPITFNDPTGASMSPMDKYWNDAMAAVSGSTYLGGESGGSGSSTTSGGNVSVLNIGGGYSIVVYWDEVPGIGATYSMENGHVRVQEFSSATLINDELFVTYANWYYDGNGKPITDNNVSATITSEFIEKFKIEFNAVADAQQGGVVLNFTKDYNTAYATENGWTVLTGTDLASGLAALQAYKASGKTITNLVIHSHGAGGKQLKLGTSILSIEHYQAKKLQSIVTQMNQVLGQVEIGGTVVFTGCNVGDFLGPAMATNIRCDINAYMNTNLTYGPTGSAGDSFWFGTDRIGGPRPNWMNLQTGASGYVISIGSGGIKVK